MKNITKFLAYTCITILFFSCDDYLDVEPTGLLIPTTIEDYELLLNSNEIVSSNDERVIFYAADDFYDIQSPFYLLLPEGSKQRASYIWDEVIYSEDQNPTLWAVPYRNIFTYNLIIDEIDAAEGNNEDLKASIKAEALTGRALEYLLLVNTFAKHYDSNTATSDLGVPIITMPDVNLPTPRRSSVEDVYNFIIEDLTQAIGNLPSDNTSRFRATKAAAYGLLARAYLFQGKYTEALQNVESALDENSFLGNYTSIVTEDPNFDNAAQFQARIALEDVFNQEQVYHRNFQASGGFSGLGYITPEVEALFEDGDLRRLVSLNDFGGFFSARLWQAFPMLSNHAISVPEMYVIRAECNARLGNLQSALDDINLIRKNRILPDFYQDIMSSDADEVLQKVLNERRIELLATGLRWFDLKRLNKEPQFAKTITHTLDGVDYTLEPNSNNYVFPIPLQVIGFNPDMEQNPRD
ncbi:RagB/SusD family nutrient uptake outer membrane protein [Aureibaculum sp. 2210JD6-5]|uniref:RagB/SusD family nutrient uptake outer membrane protein n=1 Tax=Aureibaculum sp. 2210JD6-5 TaxID=3103957 RepID=UPI002AAD309B|nr:RagB/SusD family nutrient uptake outer membrane protein [Aureibaculum sp. 2210JD6-5]MDY7396756.1 RagB/SusD family nutrient uptake outer membrane protein [Aureibaculum sp. 2210JD6-5]